MSNRVLIFSVAGIFLLLGIAVFLMLKQTDSGSFSAAPMPGPAPAGPAQGSRPESASCARNFDATRLAGSRLDIENRRVAIQVRNYGVIELELFDRDAPKAVENFLRLADAGFYDCLTFHRVAKGFVIQGGDPNGNGSGGQSAFGKPFEDELNPVSPSQKAGYKKGVLAMANSGPNTNGSQFFIMLEDAPMMPPNYTIFGRVTSGQEVVDRIGQTDITPQMGPNDGSPITPVVMEKVELIK